MWCLAIHPEYEYRWQCEPKAVAATFLAGSLTEALFVYNSSAACYWYNTRLLPTEQTQQQFQTAGWLAGQALHNRTALGVQLAPLLWQKVLEGDRFQASSRIQTASLCEQPRPVHASC